MVDNYIGDYIFYRIDDNFIKSRACPIIQNEKFPRGKEIGILKFCNIVSTSLFCKICFYRLKKKGKVKELEDLGIFP